MIPNVKEWRLCDVRVPACLVDAPALAADAEGFARLDLTIHDGMITGLVPAGSLSMDTSMPMLARAGRILLPCFVDVHTHLDKGHITHRAPNPDGTFMGALTTVMQDRAQNWSAADVARRMEFALNCAYAHGTRTIRTHLDSIGPQTRISWPVFAKMREAWSGRVELQASPLFGIDHALNDTHLADVMAMVKELGSSLLGAVTYPVPELEPGLDRLFRLAIDNGYDLDFHVDETKDPSARTLKTIAQTALRLGFRGRILAGHCCSLAMQDEEEVKATIDLVAKAGISVVSLPMCNLYLQDRMTGRTPRWRGVTLLHELKAVGVEVMIASDNTRDPFYAYGDLDMLEVWREGTRIAHLDHPYADWGRAVVTSPAAIMRQKDARLATGQKADFIMLEASSWTQLFARPHMDRVVVRDGLPIMARPPDYSHLK